MNPVEALDATVQQHAAEIRRDAAARGMAPLDLRNALVGLQTWARREMDKLRVDPAAGPWLAWLEPRLASLVPPEAPAPPGGPPAMSPALASIFGNAQSTSKEVPWANMKYSTVAMLTCVHCGGPQHAPADFVCRYCKKPIA